MLTAALSALAQASTADNGRTLVVQLKGKAVGETRTIPPVEATGTTSEGNCFDVDLVDVLTAQAAGTARRCFSDVRTVGGGMSLTDTTFFRLREGTLVSRHQTIIQPTIESPPDVTHIATFIPAPATTTLLANAGTGAFRGVSGSTRLAGAMDMRQFRERNEIAFNDLYLIQLANQPAERLVERQVEGGESLDRQARIREAQRQLREAGFAPGSVDGVMGPQTRVALQQFQAKHGLPRTGELDEATRKALRIQ